MNFIEFVKSRVPELTELGFFNPEEILWELVSFCSGYSKHDLCLSDLPETFDEALFEDKFFDAYDKVLAGEPLQYVLGIAYFRKLDLFVNKSVLIPRPETELIVDIAAKYLHDMHILGQSAKIADICTGSGCIGLSCAYELGSHVFSSDISEDALEVAKKNCTKYRSGNLCMFKQGYLCEPFFHLQGEFDCVLSNPPYVPIKTYESLSESVKLYEPKIALVAGDDGCKYIFELADGAHNLLKSGGLFVCEVNSENAYDFKDMIDRSGFQNTRIVKDLAGRDRFIVGYK